MASVQLLFFAISRTVKNVEKTREKWVTFCVDSCRRHAHNKSLLLPSWNTYRNFLILPPKLLQLSLLFYLAYKQHIILLIGLLFCDIHGSHIHMDVFHDSLVLPGSSSARLAPNNATANNSSSASRATRSNGGSTRISPSLIRALRDPYHLIGARPVESGSHRQRAEGPQLDDSEWRRQVLNLKVSQVFDCSLTIKQRHD